MKKNTQQKKYLLGFTLLELMIVIAIIGILAAVVYPSYAEHLRKGRRDIAQGELLAFSSAMEQYYVQNSSDYEDSTASDKKPDIYASVITINGVDMYDLTISNITTSSYTISAAPKSGTAQASDGTLTITNTGARTWKGASGW
jgi:type IV pilus assembly protein PilE